MLAGAFIFGRGHSGPTGPAEDPHFASVRGFCTYAFKQVANDPGSVSFDDRSTWIVKNEGGNDWSVTFGLRAKNAFGAIIHGYYKCLAHDDGDSMHLIAMDKIG